MLNSLKAHEYPTSVSKITQTKEICKFYKSSQKYFQNYYTNHIVNNQDLLQKCLKSGLKNSNEAIIQKILNDKPEILKNRVNMFGDTFLHYFYRVNGVVQDSYL